MLYLTQDKPHHTPWNKGKITGQKPPLKPYEYGTHSMLRTKVSMIYQKTKNIRAIQLLLGHSNLESTVRYLGVELDDALDVAENTEI